ncbi:MAG: cadmium-translocating P-type ATPase [Bacilli bacterium]|nr:cadmium-translocating P-type ATPase [Bacilli bacterium]
MMKKVYTIRGFDCANCAAKTESFLNHDARIEYARIDFAGARLYITYKDQPLSIEEIKRLIKQVESNDLYISDAKQNVEREKFFTTKNIILLGRIIIAAILMFVGRFAFFRDQNNIACLILYLIAILIVGYSIFYKVIYKIIHLKNPIDEFLLITLAVVGVSILTAVFPEEDGRYEPFFDATMVILLFQIGQMIEHYATNKSRNAISTAVDERSETATYFDGIETKTIKSQDLKVGDLIIVKVGETIPVDSEVIEGEGNLDISSLTGEYVPKHVKAGDEALSGCMLKSGTLTLQVKKIYQESTVSKILELVASSGEHKAKAENFITKFAKYYTPGVIIAAILLLVIWGSATTDWVEATKKALNLIVIACPCAIVISVPLSYFAGIGLASKNGIIVKGANYLDELVKLKKLVSDKTGTLTHGAFMLTKVVPNKLSVEQFKEYLYAAECLSDHPIAKAIMHEVKAKDYINAVKNYQEEAGKGVSLRYQDHAIVVGSRFFLSSHRVTVDEVSDIGTVIYLAVDGQYAGYAVLSDELKKDAQPMVNLLHHAGVEIVLLTGDKEETAKETCEALGIDRWHSELLPDEKTKYLEMEMSDPNKKVAFIGDGINDAPSIMRSDIGIAMGGIGSDIAVNHADVVIMNDNPAKVYDAHKIAKMTRNRAWFCVVFSLAVKFGVMIVDIVVKDMDMIYSVLADTGLTVLMIICAFVLLYQKVRRPKHI